MSRGLENLKHIVVLMMSSRSFDHMLGALKAWDPRIDGLTGNETNPDTTGAFVKVQPLAEYQGQLTPDPGHSFPDVDLQVFSGSQSNPRVATMQGFIQSYFQKHENVNHSHKIMYYFAPHKLPVLAALATQFAVFNGWFSSLPGPTICNRAFAHYGTSFGHVGMNVFYRTGPYLSIYERMLQAKRTAKIYCYDLASPGDVNLLKSQPQLFSTYDRFLNDCAHGTLPDYSFVEPNFADHEGDFGFELASDQHPDHNVQAGEIFIASVYNAIRANPTLWQTTALLIVYDQHGGIYDHVPPAVCMPDGFTASAQETGIGAAFAFDRLGVRVPAVLVSPWIPKGTVVDGRTFEHASIPATVTKFFLGSYDSRSPREKNAETFLDLLSDQIRPDSDCLVFDLGDGRRRPRARKKKQPISDLLLARLMELREMEKSLPVDQQTGIDIDTLKTEGDASAYIQQVMAKLRPQGATIPGPPSLRMLADVPLPDEEADQLGFRPFANALTGVIDSPRTTTPLVMAINGKWGAGKTTLGLMIKRRLQNKPAADGYSPHVVCWFDAWMHDDAPTLATSLAAEVAQTANRFRALWRRFLSPLPSALTSGKGRWVRKLLYLVALTLALVICAIVLQRLGYGLSEMVDLDPKLVKALTSIPTVATLLAACILLINAASALLPVAKSVAEFVRDPQSSAKTASMREVRHQLGRLIKRATPKGSKFVIFIDDLDRCRPPHSVDILEVINQLLDHSGVVVIIMADMQAIARCAEVKYKVLAELSGRSRRALAVAWHTRYGWLHLQKIVQLQFDLPTYPVESIRHMIEALAKRIPEGQGQERPLGQVGLREKLQRYFSLWRRRFLWWTSFVGRRRTDRVRQQIDSQIKQRIAAGESDFSKVQSAIMSSSSGLKDDPSLQGFLRERLLHYLENESQIQREAEDEVIRHIQPLPRHAKRLLNRLRLLLFVAHKRKMFGGSPALGPRHIGKWAVLCERWPEFAQSLAADPGAMAVLEGVPDGKKPKLDRYEEVLAAVAPVYLHDDELKRFLRSEICLSPVMERIVRFQPAEEGSKQDGLPVIAIPQPQNGSRT